MTYARLGSSSLIQEHTGAKIAGSENTRHPELHQRIRACPATPASLCHRTCLLVLHVPGIQALPRAATWSHSARATRALQAPMETIAMLVQLAHTKAAREASPVSVVPITPIPTPAAHPPQIVAATQATRDSTVKIAQHALRANSSRQREIVPAWNAAMASSRVPWVPGLKHLAERVSPGVTRNN